MKKAYDYSYIVQENVDVYKESWRKEDANWRWDMKVVDKSSYGTKHKGGRTYNCDHEPFFKYYWPPGEDDSKVKVTLLIADE